jgi:hypothetical protein
VSGAEARALRRALEALEVRELVEPRPSLDARKPLEEAHEG